MDRWGAVFFCHEDLKQETAKPQNVKPQNVKVEDAVFLLDIDICNNFLIDSNVEYFCGFAVFFVYNLKLCFLSKLSQVLQRIHKVWTL